MARPSVQFSADHCSAAGLTIGILGLLDRPSKPRQPESVSQTETHVGANQTETGARPVRTRTYSWSDPAELAELVGTSAGLDLMRQMADGKLPRPPIMHTLGVDDFEMSDGQATFRLTPREFHYNPLGTVHGGVIATLLDSAAGCSLHTTLAAGTAYTSLDLNVRFLRPVTVDSGQLRCTGSVISRGRTTALIEARLTDAAGRLCAHATSTCMLFALPPS
jgi:uncharacterized protein (TIGR00369 family)